MENDREEKSILGCVKIRNDPRTIRMHEFDINGFVERRGDEKKRKRYISLHTTIKERKIS